MALATILLMAYHATSLTTYLGLVLAFGIPVCWYLKKWGIITFIFLLAFILFFKGDSIAGEGLWHIGLAASIILTLFLCSNGLEEANELVEESRGNSKAHQQALDQLKSELEGYKFKLQNEQRSASAQIENLSSDLRTSAEKLNFAITEANNYKNEISAGKNEIELAKQMADQFRIELENKNAQEERVLDELLEKRSEVIFLRDQLLEMQHELNQRPAIAQDVQNNEENEQLKEILLKKEQDLFNLQFRLDSALEDIQEDVDVKKENGLRRRAEGLYSQLKNQFEEKSLTLDETRRQLFYAEEKLLQLEKELKEREEFNPDPQVERLMGHINQMQHQIEQSEQEVTQLNEIISALS
jgi:hypothetical protein